jgi:hypothetical protein
MRASNKSVPTLQIMRPCHQQRCAVIFILHCVPIKVYNISAQLTTFFVVVDSSAVKDP